MYICNLSITNNVIYENMKIKTYTIASVLPPNLPLFSTQAQTFWGEYGQH